MPKPFSGPRSSRTQVLAVPVKSPRSSKTRLAPVLSADERATLTTALLEDVLAACLAQHDWRTWVISSDPEILALAQARGARPIPERATTLLGAMRQVEAAAGNAAALAIVLGDLPYLTAAELDRALANPGHVVAARAVDGGTNLLLRRPPLAIRARFGTASFDKHRWAARRAGIDLTQAHGEGLERDLDTPQDLLRLLRSGRPGRTRSACMRMGLSSRLVLDSVGTEG